MDPPPTYVADIVATVVREVRPERVLLFGSYARGTASAGSDVDLLVIADSLDPVGTRGQAVAALLRDRAPRTDLLWHTPEEVAAALRAPASFLADVLRRGIVVYETPLDAHVESRSDSPITN